MADPNLLPDGINDERNRALATLIDGPGTIDLSPALVNFFDTVPASVLPYLVERYALQDFVTDDLPEEAIRSLLKGAIDLHRFKGTRYAVRQALESLGLNAIITEWWEETPEGDPYTFKVLALVNQNFSTDEVVLSAKRLTQAERLVKAVKPVSRRFTLELGVEVDGATRMAGIMRPTQLFTMKGML